MQIAQKSKLIQKYLDFMPAISPASAELMQTATLKDLRRFAPKEISQIELAKALGRNKSTVSGWETGKRLNGIGYKEVLIMANLFNRRIEEVIAAIANTATEPEELNQNAPPPEVVPR